MRLEYSSNNSGGSWWLSDDDWRAMEAAGWNVEWRDERWLGGLATRAWIDTDSVDATISEWESITGQNANDQGCNCCGQPHYFSYTDDAGNSHYRETYTESYFGGWN